MAKGKMTAPPLRRGAIAATFRPGFKARTPKKPRAPYRILCLTFDTDVNEFITGHYKNLGGTETEKTAKGIPPGYKSPQDLHVLDKVALKNLKNWQDARGKYELFEQKTKDGPLYRYGTSVQVAKEKDANAKKLLTTAS
ncbi:MAG: hypothetical protein WC657_05740 [Candidatus Paceibacterota bacterium]|jgi:hypothetical protein